VKVKAPLLFLLQHGEREGRKNYSTLNFRRNGEAGGDVWVPSLYVVFIEGVVELPYHTVLIIQVPNVSCGMAESSSNHSSNNQK